MADRWRVIDGVLRVSGAIAGTLAPSLLLAAALAAYLPLARGVALTVAILAAIPLWVAAMCAAFLARHGWRVWIACALATLALAWLVPHARW